MNKFSGLRFYPFLALLLANCIPAAALDFSALLSQAVAHDRASAGLARETALAEARWRRAGLAATALQFTAQTGPISARFAGATSLVSGDPSLSVSGIDGTRISLRAPLQQGTDGTSIDPELGGELPLIRGPAEQLLALASAEAELEQARRAQEARRLEVEAFLVDRLRSLLSAQLRAYRSRQSVLSATTDRLKVERVDGAVPGGTSWEAKDRVLRLASRDLRRAEAEVQSLRAAFDLFAGTREADTLELPAPDPDAALPPIEQTLSVIGALEDLRLARVRATETGRTATLVLGWGLGYQLSSAEQGPTARTGLRADWGDFAVEGGVDWKSLLGPGLTFSFQWQPRPDGDQKWKTVADNLVLEGFSAAVDASRETATLQLVNLETRRRDLKAASEEALTDLAYARDQLALYKRWSEKGLVTTQELEEVENSVSDARTAQELIVLDWQTWDVDRRRLGAALKEQ